MAIQLRDIIDLDFLLSLDQQKDSERETIAARDRDIFTQMDPPPGDDQSLLLSWLEFRRLLFFDEAGNGEQVRLPGTLFASLHQWLVWILVGTGFFSGLSMAYSFLAYHGTRPVNVTLFFAVFILVQVILVMLTLTLPVGRWIRNRTGNRGDRGSLVQVMTSWLFLKGLTLALNRLGRSVNEKKRETMEYTASLVRMKNQEYRAILFWPFFILSSYFAASFSAGALGGTLFRVAVYDMAFGWQSTLVTASDRIHQALGYISLPWSWLVPESLAHPSLDQIEGSRLLLKEGISTLATADLVSWWPFLCLGILFYAILPRVFLILAGFLAQKQALGNFDFERPRFQQLKIRMQSPIMDIQFNETPVSRAGSQNPLAERSFPGGLDPKRFDPEPDPIRHARGTRALVLASPSVGVETVLTRVSESIGRQLYFQVGGTAPISFDLDQDLAHLEPLAREPLDQVIVLQEVWQPPIRGLLHYYVQLKTQVFKNLPVWIFLIQAPGETDLSVDREEIDFKVWKKAIDDLGHPDILVERMVQ